MIFKPRHFGVLLGFILTLISGCVAQLSFTPARVTRLATTQPTTNPSQIVVRMDVLPGGLPAVMLGPSDQTFDKSNYSFAVIDTGAVFPLLTEQYAKKRQFKIAQTRTVGMIDAFGNSQLTPHVASVPSLRAGDASFEDFDAVVADLPGMRSFSNHLDVILALPMFRDVLLTIDYPHQQLILEPGGSLPEPDGKDVFPLKRDKSGHLLMPLKIVGEEAWLEIDTAHTGRGLLLSRYRLIGIPWASPPVEGDPVQGFLSTKTARIGRMNGDIVLGRFTLHRPILAISYRDEDELIGADVLRNFVVTIDQKNLRIRLAAPTDRTVIDFWPVRRLGFTADSDGVVKLVQTVDAEPSVLRDGDRILSLNGYPREKLSGRLMEYLEARGEPLHVRVLRDGNEVTMSVPIGTIVP